ncbi:hypothetical protein EYF80_044290 [Liparis tanakae]|uniref:Uncharacterized protein n=1 Tax=Liparis tanakae TaxID=230148 RepID=A0A4Z2FW84_9TELE|nr:hypothetical protein EYF80_044290 [Liparis tanakae]
MKYCTCSTVQGGPLYLLGPMNWTVQAEALAGGARGAALPRGLDIYFSSLGSPQDPNILE